MDETISHKTAAPSVGDWLNAMQAAVDDGADGLLVRPTRERTRDGRR
jgi:hypothetical protein